MDGMTDTPTPERVEQDHITEALNDLEHAVKGEYGFPSVHPAMQRKYDRDMAIVTDAREAYHALRAECARERVAHAVTSSAYANAALRVKTLTAECARKDAEIAARDRVLLNLAAAWHHGNWKAETLNEREMEADMRVLEFWPITEDQIIARREQSHPGAPRDGE